MKRYILIWGFLLCNILAYTQEIQLTFSGTGATHYVEMIEAINLSTNDTVIFPGNQTLLLGESTGIEMVQSLDTNIELYPNPCKSSSHLKIYQNYPDKATISVYNTSGIMFARSVRFLEPGWHSFDISFSAPGLYLVQLSSNSNHVSTVVSCYLTEAGKDEISYRGNSVSTPDKNQGKLKSNSSGYSIGYSEGDILVFKCRSGKYTTIITDSPVVSKEYEIEFVECSDPHDRNYEIVKIGDQVWMAENMAYLPEVSPTTDTSSTESRYYVYEYDNYFAISARLKENYIKYGALYNRKALENICPQNWHLPTDEDWQNLEAYLGMEEDDLNKQNPRFSGKVGEKLKSKQGWKNNKNGTDITGFKALPGGSVGIGNIRYSAGSYTKFWTLTEHYPELYFGRGLYHNKSAVSRYMWPSSAALHVRCIMNDPQVITNNVTDITYTTAMGGGRIIYPLDSIQIVTRGLCWSQDPEPTIESNVVECGSGYGEFSGKISGLSWGEWYYVRAFFISSKGETIYGKQKKFVSGGALFLDERDNSIYKYATIGSQTWMTENMRYLPVISDYSARSLDSALYYVYDYRGEDLSEARASNNYQVYGTLYNYEAAKTACPPSWHLPSDEEYKVLERYLGMSQYDSDQEDYRLSGQVGYKLKSSQFWNEDGNGDNSSMFNALPAGRVAYLSEIGFDFLGEACFFWTSTTVNTTVNPLRRILSASSDGVHRTWSLKEVAQSVRCIKN